MSGTIEAEIIEVANRAGMLAGEGRFEEARAFLAPALDRLPPHPHLWHNWAQILTDLRQTREAERWFTEILARWPDFLPSYATLIWLKRIQFGPQPGRPARTELARLLNNQGNAVQATGDHEKAVASYREALTLDEQYANAWSNLSNSLRVMGLVSEADVCARKALAIAPEHVGAWNNLGCALIDLGRSGEADRCFAEVLQIQPGHPEARHNASGGRLFNLLFLEKFQNSELFEEHRNYGQKLRGELLRRPDLREPIEGKIRVGFLSGDFRVHAMAMFVAPLLEHLDRTQFEVFCYANQSRFDQTSEFIRRLPLTWREVAALTDDACASLIRNDSLDILVDLSGHTDGQRLDVLTLRPAPVIATWLGYMSTTGHQAIDFRVTDRWTDPEPDSARVHTEKLAYLSGSQFTFRPEPSAPNVSTTPALARGWVTFGSLNNVRKLSNSVIRTWAAILGKIPGSRLILQAKLFADPGTIGYFRGLFEAVGIESNRVDMRPYSHGNQHFNTYQEIDIALDPFPYCGGATTCDALWMGVPVVTLASHRSVGRMGVSMLQNLGRPEWIAADHTEYVRIATGLASDLTALNQVRLGLRPQVLSSPLRDEPGFARNFGDTLVQMLTDARSLATRLES